MKTKQEIIDALEFQIRQEEIDYLKKQDVLAEALDYVRSSKDERVEMIEQFNDPKERAKHDPSYEGYTGITKGERK